MAVTQKVTLYNNKFTVPPVINAVQNDTDRHVEAYFGDFTLQVGMTGKLSFIRSDGTHYEVSATLNTGANTATAELDQALTQAGVTQAQLKITDSGNVGSTFTFMIKVQPDVAGISVPQDGWSAQEFDQRLTDAENAIDAVEEDVADLQDKEYDYAPVITDTASGAIASFPDGADSYPLKECVVSIEAVQSGSGDPSPDNIRPITGWSEAKVTRAGKNLYSRELSEYNVPVFSTNGTSQAYPDVTVYWLKVKPDTAYTVSGTTPSGQVFYIRWINCDENKGFISRPGGTYTSPALPLSFTTPSNCEWVQIAINQYNVGYLSKNDWLVQVEEGSTATDYEPYNGQTVTIDLDGTRYGCTLDVRRGKLRVNRAMVDLGTLNWSYYSDATTSFFSAQGPSSIKPVPSNTDRANMICSQYSVRALWNDGFSTSDNVIAQASPSNLRVRDSAYTDAAAFKTAMNGVQLVYELATPIEVDLTPTEITTLLGTNNVWADCGDIEVEYCADTKRYIQKLISQLA